MWQRLGKQRGSELLEYALVLPLLMVLVLGIMDFGLIFFSYETLESAVREGARVGVIDPVDQANIASAVRGQTICLDQSLLNVAIAYPGSNLIEVSATYDAPIFSGFITQFFSGNSAVTLRSSAMMAIE